MNKTALSPQPIHLKDYKPHPFTIGEMNLTFDIYPDRTVVTNRFRAVRRNPGDNAPLVLMGEKMKLLEVNWPETTVTEETLTLYGLGESAELTTVVEIHPHENTALEGLYASGAILCTQNEPEGFRKITYSIDRPDNLARYRTTIVADPDQYPHLLSNGNKVAEKIREDGRLQVTWEDPFPKPSYLFALVAGKFDKVEDSFTTRSGRKVALEIFVDPGQAYKVPFAMESLKKAMKWDEDRFGLEYDLDIFMIVAVSAFNMGAMENKGLNIFNASAVLAHFRTTTDAGFLRIEGIIGHEYFHNWTGDRVTCRDWFQLTLKEGLTVFRDQEFSADLHSPGVLRIAEVEALRNAQFKEDAGPMSHPIQPQSYIEINNFYTPTVYEKGAEVIRMIHTFLGEENFQKGMKLYFERHDGQAVTTEDFVASMEAASGFDLGEFRRWYTQAGTPVLEVSDHWSEGTGTYSLTVKQKTAPLFMPLKVAGFSGGEKVLQEQLLTLSRPTQTWNFTGLDSRPLPSLNRFFTAPVILHYPYKDEDLLNLFAWDDDPWCRYEAGQKYMKNEVLRQYQGRLSGQNVEIPSRWVQVFHQLLTGDLSDPLFLSLCLSLPSLETLSSEFKTLDYQGFFAVTEELSLQLAQALEKVLDEAWSRLDGQTPQGRALRNLILNYLSYLGTRRWSEVIWTQMVAAANMSDELTALSLLVHRNDPRAQEALDIFYDRWKGDELVLHHWFRVQATLPADSVRGRLEALEQHPLFQWTQPNRVRALVHAFVQGNPVAFHSADGWGYQYLAQKIRHLDPLNPQITARLVNYGLNTAPRLDPKRKKLVKSALQPVLKTPGLSRDTYEILSRTLETL